MTLSKQFVRHLFALRGGCRFGVRRQTQTRPASSQDQAYCWHYGSICYNHDSEFIEVISDPGDITRLLRQWKGGDREIESQLFELLLPDLRKIARHHFQKE